MWKRSVQHFHRHLFSRTAVNIKNVLNGYQPKSLKRFVLIERGKKRDIDAPHIDDRQIQKTITQKVLLPLYQSRLIYDNGASLKGKGLHFSQNQLDKEIRKHRKRYGDTGWVIVADFKRFFPNADRNVIKIKHQEIKDSVLKSILDTITEIGRGDRGLPLGVEPSQVEMISLPSRLDNYLACQLGLSIGHYMDDYHILVPPTKDPKMILNAFIAKAAEDGILISRPKTRIVPMGKPFKFCKCKRIFYGDKIIKRGNPGSLKRLRRKIKSFSKRNTMKDEDKYTSINSSFAYLKMFDWHKSYLRLSKLFYDLYGFNPEQIDRVRRTRNVIHMLQ